MLSAQLNTEFTLQNYDGIKKVYSIWICMNAPKHAAYTITRYRMIKEDIHGHVERENRYDLLEAVMVCLGSEENLAKGNKLHGMLATLLSDKLSPQEKGIEQGIEEGKIISLSSLVAQGLLTKEVAARQLDITVAEFVEEMKKAGY